MCAVGKVGGCCVFLEEEFEPDLAKKLYRESRMTSKNDSGKEGANPYVSPARETPNDPAKEGCSSAIFLFLLVPILLLGILIFLFAGKAVSMPNFPVLPD